MTGNVCVNSGFRCKADENCTLLECYTVISGNFLLMYWYNLSVPSSRVKNYRFKN